METLPADLYDLLVTLVALLEALWLVVVQLVRVVLPWLPLAAWVAFWLFGVNWVRLRRVLVLEWGWIGLVLIGLVAVMVWGAVDPPAEGHHWLLGLKVSNYVGKTVYVTALAVIAFICGSVQLSGCCGVVNRFEEDELAQLEAADASHGRGH